MRKNDANGFGQPVDEFAGQPIEPRISSSFLIHATSSDLSDP
jgi:hypothetical protein